jgi:hypothetical protein
VTHLVNVERWIRISEQHENVPYESVQAPVGLSTYATSRTVPVGEAISNPEVSRLRLPCNILSEKRVAVNSVCADIVLVYRPRSDDAKKLSLGDPRLFQLSGCYFVSICRCC